MSSARTVGARAALVAAGILVLAVGAISAEPTAQPFPPGAEGAPTLPGLDLGDRVSRPAPLVGVTPPAGSSPAPSDAASPASAPPAGSPAVAEPPPPAAVHSVPAPAAPPVPTTGHAPSSEPTPPAATPNVPPAEEAPAVQDRALSSDDEDTQQPEADEEGLRIRFAGVDVAVETDLFDPIFG